MTRQRLVVFSGAGVSAESGLRTFRDSDGLWEEHRIEDVATPEAWRRDPATVLRFYDMRREQVLAARPNAAHRAIADLEDRFHVEVVTQNIDDLHERAGSTRVLHLHGEILKVRSTAEPTLITRLNGTSLRLGDRCALGSQLRPHIVWFGEEVPEMQRAAALISKADVLVVVGTSLQVYPAAGLIHYLPRTAEMFVVDPKDPQVGVQGAHHWKQKASEGLPALALHLRKRISDR
ncbi:MAG: NAD-dependent deacylase [Flavobacteriales bacterium]|nr:NAD-dependent deacylase [Flavobacteriales bacterium]